VPTFAGLSYRLLAQVSEQWPIIGRSDLYYGGTSYENKQGLGVQLAFPSQIPSLAWPEVLESSNPESTILAVPVTILYDRGGTVLPSQMILKSRIPFTHITVHPEQAGSLNISDGQRVRFTLNGTSVEAIMHTNENIPQGVAIVPRSLGIPISAPVAVDFTGIELLEG
jgi:NADH-quinone oxidoreductase subunit G